MQTMLHYRTCTVLHKRNLKNYLKLQQQGTFGPSNVTVTLQLLYTSMLATASVFCYNSFTN